MSTIHSSTSFSNPAILAATLHLCIGGKLICHKFLQMLCQSLSTPDYYIYLQKKLTWTVSIVAQVHWTVLQRSINMFLFNDQWHLVLFINNEPPYKPPKLTHTMAPHCAHCVNGNKKIPGTFLNAPTLSRRHFLPN